MRNTLLHVHSSILSSENRLDILSLNDFSFCAEYHIAFSWPSTYHILYGFPKSALPFPTVPIFPRGPHKVPHLYLNLQIPLYQILILHSVLCFTLSLASTWSTWFHFPLDPFPFLPLISLNNKLLEDKFLFVYFLQLERQKKRDTRREFSYTPWFTPQMPTVVRSEPSGSQEPGTQSRSSIEVTGAQTLEPLSSSSQDALAGSCIGSGVAGV